MGTTVHEFGERIEQRAVNGLVPVTAHEYMGYTGERIERISESKSVQSDLESVDSFDRG